MLGSERIMGRARLVSPSCWMACNWCRPLCNTRLVTPDCLENARHLGLCNAIFDTAWRATSGRNGGVEGARFGLCPWDPRGRGLPVESVTSRQVVDLLPASKAATSGLKGSEIMQFDRGQARVVSTPCLPFGESESGPFSDGCSTLPSSGLQRKFHR